MLLVAAFGCIGIGVGVWNHLSRPLPEVPNAGSGMPHQAGARLIAIYIGSSDCYGSKLPDFPAVEQQTMRALADIAATEHMDFVKIGVSVDESPAVGGKYLNKFGPFDAVAVGLGWMNPLAIRYVWRDFPGDASIPQIVAVRQVVRPVHAGATVSPDSILGRLIGKDGMQFWLANRRRLVGNELLQHGTATPP